MASPKMTIKAQNRALKRAKSRFGIPEDVCVEMIDRSEGCQICGSAFKGSEPYLDHDHRTGAFRGFLCKPCNFVLGFARDKPVVLQRAIEYLKSPPAYGKRTGPKNPSEEKPRRWTKPASGRHTPFFERLNSARILNGATYREVCEAIGVSVPTWFKWRRGAEPRSLMRKAAEAYIATACQSGKRETTPPNGEIRLHESNGFESLQKGGLPRTAHPLQ